MLARGHRGTPPPRASLALGRDDVLFVALVGAVLLTTRILAEVLA
jgi:hypothetical protein